MERLTGFLENARRGPGPSRPQWDLFMMQALSDDEHRAMEEQIARTPASQQRVEEWKAERDAFQAALNVPSFLAALEAKASERAVHPAEEPIPPVAMGEPEADSSQESGAGWRGWLQRLVQPAVWAPLSACAALALLWWVQPFSTSSPDGMQACAPLERLDSGVRRKGGPALEVFVFRQGQRSLARSGATFRSGDILALRYKSSAFRYLSVVYLDHKGELSWLYPQREAPSIPVAAQGDLDGSVALDDAKGTERLLAFFSSQPLQPHDVRALAARKPPSGHLRLSCSSSNRVFLRELILRKR